MKSLLELKDVSSGYFRKNGSGEKPVLCGINLSVKEGELLVIAGPNGSGKTTLLKTAGGLLHPLNGRVEIDGKDVYGLKPRERSAFTAFLLQIRETPWPFTVRETIAQGRFARLGWLGRETRDDREAINAAIEKAGLASLVERNITELSGGELQRVFIARCIAQGAAFLLLDEPDNNLDPMYAYMILTLLQELVREGRGAIISLHNLRLASRFADKIALLSASAAAQNRSIAAFGPPEEALTVENLCKVYDMPEELVHVLVL